MEISHFQMIIPMHTKQNKEVELYQNKFTSLCVRLFLNTRIMNSQTSRSKFDVLGDLNCSFVSDLFAEIEFLTPLETKPCDKI